MPAALVRVIRGCPGPSRVAQYHLRTAGDWKCHEESRKTLALQQLVFKRAPSGQFLLDRLAVAGIAS
jgi:hypothetical protein